MNKTLFRFVLVAGLLVAGLAQAGTVTFECTAREAGFTNLNNQQSTSTPVKNGLVYFVTITDGVVDSYYPATNQKTAYDQTRLISSGVTGNFKTTVFERPADDKTSRLTLVIDTTQTQGRLQATVVGQTRYNASNTMATSRATCVL